MTDGLKDTPGVYFRKPATLIIYDQRGATKKYTTQVQLNKEYAFEFHYRYEYGGVYKYYIVLDGQEVRNVTINARQRYDVGVWGSNPGNVACIGTISELTLTNFL